MLLKKMMSLAEKYLLARLGVDFRSASVLSGASDGAASLTSVRSGLLCDAGSTPINHSAKVLFLFFHTNSSEHLHFI